MKSKKVGFVADVVLASAVVLSAGYAALGRPRPIMELEKCCSTVSCNIPGGTIARTLCSVRDCSSEESCFIAGECVNGRPANLVARCE